MGTAQGSRGPFPSALATEHLLMHHQKIPGITRKIESSAALIPDRKPAETAPKQKKLAFGFSISIEVIFPEY
jgi:hypothetical protein